MRQGRNETLAVVALGVLAAGACAAYWLRGQRQRSRPIFDYSDRSGFPKPAAQMRGLARRQPSRASMA
jgi:hypothetical protein